MDNTNHLNGTNHYCGFDGSKRQKGNHQLKQTFYTILYTCCQVSTSRMKKLIHNVDARINFSLNTPLKICILVYSSSSISVSFFFLIGTLKL